jgi:hypothetical protein
MKKIEFGQTVHTLVNVGVIAGIIFLAGRDPWLAAICTVAHWP